MDDLLAYLKTVNEMDEEALQPIKTHYGLASQISKLEVLKKEAAMNEEYESAASYKKQITKL